MNRQFIKYCSTTKKTEFKITSKSLEDLQMAKLPKSNPHTGGSFDDFLIDDGIFEEVQTRAINRALTQQLDDCIQIGRLNNVDVSQRIASCPSQLDQVIAPSNFSI